MNFFAAVTFHTGCETYPSFNQQSVFSRRKEAAVEPTKIRIRCAEEEWTRVKKRIRNYMSAKLGTSLQFIS